jgi:hypothetical protein
MCSSNVVFSDTVTDISIPMVPQTATGLLFFLIDLKKLVIARNVGTATTGGVGGE